jgi:cation diffusion facilitator family transporter
MIYKGAISIARVVDSSEVCKITPAVFWVAIFSVLAKEIMYHLTRRVAIKSNSSALYANAWHHRSDALSSVAVLVGFVAVKMGYLYGDQIAAVIVGLMVIMVGAHIARQCIDEFLEKTVDNDTIIQIKKTIAAEDRIRQWHKLRTRYVGREVFVDMHILVDPELNVADAHEITVSLENSLHEQIARPTNITIHIEPDSPEQRK